MTLASLVVKLGVETAEFRRQMDDVARRTQRLARSITSAGKEISKAISLPIIAAGFLAFRAALEESHRSFGPLFRAFETLKAVAHDLWAELGRALTPVFLQIIEVLRRVVDWIRGLVDAFNRLSPATKKIIVNTLLFLAALGPTIVVLGKFVGALAAIPSVLLTLTSPIGLVITAALALGAAAAFVVTHWEKVKIRLLLFWLAIKEAFFDGVGAVLSVMQFLTGWIPVLGKAINKLKDNFDAFVDRSLQKTIVAIDRMEKGLQDVAPAIQRHAELSLEARQALADLAAAQNQIAQLAQVMGPNFEAAAARVQALETAIRALVAAGVSGQSGLLQGEAFALQQARIDALVESLNHAVTAQANFARATGNSIGEVQARAEVLRTTIEALTAQGLQLDDMVGKTGLSLRTFVQMWKDASLQASVSAIIMQGALDAVVGAMQTLADRIGQIFAGTAQGFRGLAAALRATVGEVLVGMGKALIQVGVTAMLMGALGKAIRKFILNPGAAIAAGAALVVLGTALASGAQRAVDSGLGTGGGGGGGGGSAASAPATSEAAQAPATIIIEGGLLDMSDPRQADALAHALETLSGRRVIIQAA